MAHKLFPVLVPADADTKAFHARSLPVLDSQRLAQLEAPMPPVYRSELSSSPDGKESGARPRPGLRENTHLQETCSPTLLILPLTPWPASGENLPYRHLLREKTPSPTAGSKHCSAKIPL
jgi:hypothetical protein